MSITAIVENDTIKLPVGVHLENGTVVQVQPLEGKGQTLAGKFGDLIGSIDSGVGDLAVNHDHYLYGLPKVKS